VCVIDGFFERVEPDTDDDGDPTSPGPRLHFHEATALTHELPESLQHTTRSRVLRQFMELSGSFHKYDDVFCHDCVCYARGMWIA
jgi:hypothetical protein